MTESLVTQNKVNQNKFITWLYKSDTHKNSYTGNYYEQYNTQTSVF